MALLLYARKNYIFEANRNLVAYYTSLNGFPKEDMVSGSDVTVISNDRSTVVCFEAFFV